MFDFKDEAWDNKTIWVHSFVCGIVLRAELGFAQALGTCEKQASEKREAGASLSGTSSSSSSPSLLESAAEIAAATLIEIASCAHRRKSERIMQVPRQEVPGRACDAMGIAQNTPPRNHTGRKAGLLSNKQEGWSASNQQEGWAAVKLADKLDGHEQTAARDGSRRAELKRHAALKKRKSDKGCGEGRWLAKMYVARVR
eukprot:5780064-Pleurochrysis_carterae.AAC.3